MYISTRLSQLILKPNTEGEISVPLEDIGAVIIDHPRVSISMPAIGQMLQHNINLIYCDDKHLPLGQLTPLYGHQLSNKRARAQLEASKPLKKRLWQQTVKAKINNQSLVLEYVQANTRPLHRYARIVKAGDEDNAEGLAARYYWKHIFGRWVDDFTRDRYGDYPNHMLNYGYTILRAHVARALRGAGLLTIIGIHHHNQYNPYCLADDIMEPYRPIIDHIVVQHLKSGVDNSFTLTRDMKRSLLGYKELEVTIKRTRMSVENAINITAYSLVECFEQTARSIKYPILSL